MDECQVCGSVGHDRRTLQLQYAYLLTEVSEKLTHDPETRFYSIRTCKGCRAAFLLQMGRWIKGGGRLSITGLDENGNQAISIKD